MENQSLTPNPTRTASVSRTSEQWRRVLLALLVLGGLSAACGEEFDPYFRVAELRVMAIRADTPSLAPNGTVNFDALTFEPSDAPLTYRWSWCPLSAGAADGYNCAVSEEDLTSFTEPAGFTVPPYELGSDPTVSFSYPDPPELIAFLCQQIQDQDLPDFFSPPDCNRGFNVLIRLEVSNGSETLTAVRELELLIDDQQIPNINPNLTEVSFLEDGQPESAAVVLTEGGEPPVLKRDTEYELRVVVPEDSSETFASTQAGTEGEDVEESLVISWFVEGGELDEERTGFIPGETTLAEASKTAWITPKRDDFAQDEVKLFMVLRDPRGGVDWAERTIRLE